MHVALKRALLALSLGAVVSGCSQQQLAQSEALTKSSLAPKPVSATSGSALMGTDGAQTYATSVVVNQYAALKTSVAAGATLLAVNDVTTLDSATFGPLGAGDLLMIIQMQGADIDQTDTATYGTVTSLQGAGLHEFIEVASVNTAANTITVGSGCSGLKNAYSAAGKTQIIRVPQFTTLNVQVSGVITAPPWDGSVGGVVALHVRDTMTLAGSVDVQALGFRGGATDNASTAAATDVPGYRALAGAAGGEKGEGIAGDSTVYDSKGGRYGRGAPANGGGGGNSYRAGGGGGSNAINANTWSGQGVMDGTTIGAGAWALDPGRSLPTSTANLANNSGGGRGGYSYSANNLNAVSTAPGNAGWGGNRRAERGGMGGHPLSPDALARLFLGGGGGAGDGDAASSGGGGRGGGLIYVMADTITGAGALVANGAAGSDTVNTHVDAPGGGGAGGTVVVRANAISAFSIAANGGNGGQQKLDPGHDEAAGPGGGGAGGYIAVSGGAVTRSAAGGLNGDTLSNGLTEFPANGATRGATGNSTAMVATASGTTVSDVPLCLEPADLAVTLTSSHTALPGQTITYTLKVTNNGPNPVTRAYVVDALPGVLSAMSWTCTSTAVNGCPAASGSSTFNANPPNTFISLPSGGSTTFTITATISANATGTLSNTATVFSPPVVNDPNLANNGANDSYILAPTADLQLAVTATPSPVDEKANVTWAVNVGNAGPSQATGLSLSFQLPPTTDVTYVSASGTGWACSRSGTVVTCTRATLAVGAAPTINIVANVLLPGGTLSWSSTVTGGVAMTDLDLSNNSVSSTTPVEAVNDPPVNTVPPTQTTPEDVPKTMSIGNGNVISVDDVDIGGGNFEITLSATAATVTLGSTGALAFSQGDGVDDAFMVFQAPKGAVNTALNGLTVTPSQNFNGVAKLSITTSDLGGTGKGGAKVVNDVLNINVTPVNDPPTPKNDDFTVDEDTPTSIDVLVNDSSLPDGPEVLSVTGFPSLPQHGTVGGGGTGPLTYTPNPNYNGSDTFTYTVSDGTATSVGTVNIFVNPVNDPPTAVDDVASVPEGSANNLINVLSNDSFAPDTNESVTVISVTPPLHGTASVEPGGSGARYTPTAGYNGSDTFTYTIRDNNGATASANVAITIGPANKPPVNQLPGAQIIDEDTTLVFSASAGRTLSLSDDDAALASVQVTFVATNGTFSLVGPTGTLVFSVGDGTDDQTMTFTGTVTDIAAALADAVFKPTPDFNGAATLQMVTNDLGNTGVGGAKIDSDTLTITVAPVNDPPTAAPDTITIAEDTSAERFDVLANDSFAPDVSETLRIVGVSQGAHGTVTIVTNGTRVTYVPEPDAFGTDTFTYTITDSNGGTATGTVTVNVINVNDPPTANADLFSIAQDTTDNLLDVLANDTYLPDPPEVLSVVVVSPASHGTVTISADASAVLYTPTAGYVGPDGFTYTLRDSSGGFAATSVTITVGADTDRDGLSDNDENLYGTSPTDPDSDDDGLSDGIEVLIGKTDPLDDDTDDDGLIDGNEDSNRNGLKDPGETDPKNADTDQDGLTDGLERGLAKPQGKNTKLTVFRADDDPTTQTNPLRPDTDGGGDADNVEDANKNGRIDADETDPNDPLDDRKDFDHDGLSDAKEKNIGLDPLDADSDDDGVVDGADGIFDTDGDGLIDALDDDSDNDHLRDGTELGVTEALAPLDTDRSAGHFVADADPSSKTDPKKVDSDSDGLHDGDEDANRDGKYDFGETDASKADTDSDGLLDGLEKTAANPTNPEIADTDSDGLKDGEEDVNANGQVDEGETDPNVADSDHGGALDGAEKKRGTDPLNKNDDYEARGGGGCASVPGGWLFVPLALWLLVRRRRAPAAGRAFVVLAVVGSAVAPFEARAQNVFNTAIDVQRFKPGTGSQDFLNIESAKVAPHLSPFAGLFVGYANSPLVLGVPGTNETVIRLVNDLTFFDLAVGLALKDHFELSLALPLSIAKGQLADNLDASLGAQHTGFGVGDLRFAPKYSFFERARALQVAVSMPLIFPTGNAKSFRGGGAVMVSPRALVELALPIFRVVANAGFNFRTAEMRLLNMSVGQEFTWGVGGEFPLFGSENVLLLQATLNGAVGLKKLTTTDVPVEVMGGLKYRIGDVLAFELAGGAGLTRGWANPKYQVVFGVSYQHAPIQLPESWFKAAEPPPDEPSTTSPVEGFGTTPPKDDAAIASAMGNAEPPRAKVPAAQPVAEPAPAAFVDIDHDGVADASDKCPKEKETVNGVDDNDGCPDKGESKIAIVGGRLQLRAKIDFTSKRATLTPGAESLIKQLALLLKANPESRLRVDVFVTDLNTLEDNNQMSAQRAATIRELLIREGVDRRRVQTRALGMERPLDPSAVELMLY